MGGTSRRDKDDEYKLREDLLEFVENTKKVKKPSKDVYNFIVEAINGIEFDEDEESKGSGWYLLKQEVNNTRRSPKLKVKTIRYINEIVDFFDLKKTNNMVLWSYDKNLTLTNSYPLVELREIYIIDGRIINYYVELVFY
jgi:hypothetical protein